jgi:alkanesulfonate monooxygenase SsuD/methylene tetrahydromethanopterin reductase-like flavin-dependent oxidoreductase (luciferase family)
MMLRLSGQIADATLFGASAGVKYFEQAMADVAAGLERAGRPADAMGYRTIALVCVDRDGGRARDIVRPVLAEFLAEFADMSTVTRYGISDELKAMVSEGGTDVVVREMPDQWIDDLALVGTPREVADKVLRWVDAGIDAIAVFLPHPSEPDTLTLLAQEVIPLVAQSQEWRGC